jgi:glycosyltransferase involved in cell wall biosynthesis
MKFLFFSQFAGSHDHGMVLRNYAIARELVRSGHEVTIVASSFAHTRMSFFWALVFARKRKFDHVVASSPSPIVIYPAFVAARICDAKLTFDIRDLWPLTLKRLGGHSANHPFVMLMQCAEDFACRHSDLVVAVPQNCERYLKSRGLQDGRFMHLPNGVGEERASEPLAQDLNDELLEMRASGKFLVGYAGAIGQANSLDCLVKALAIVDSKIVCVLAGEGECVSELQELSVRLGISDRVIFIGRIRKAEVGHLLELVDAGYLAAQKSSLYRFGVSATKLNDYAMAALPIIYGIGDKRNPVSLSGCGIEFQPESHESCASALERLVELSPAEREVMGMKGREWVIEHQLWSSQAKLFLKRLGSL